jgi:hypothetical protein
VVNEVCDKRAVSFFCLNGDPKENPGSKPRIKINFFSPPFFLDKKMKSFVIMMTAKNERIIIKFMGLILMKLTAGLMDFFVLMGI